MIQFISLAVDLINRYFLWLYAACVVLILVYLRVFLLSSRERAGTIFSLEREIGAQRQARALWSIGGVLAIMVTIAALRLYVIPSLDIEKMAEPTEPTPFAFFPTTEPPTPTPTRVTPTPTTRALPTLRRRTSTPTLEPTVIPSPACPNANARLPVLQDRVWHRRETRSLVQHRRHTQATCGGWPTGHLGCQLFS